MSDPRVANFDEAFTTTDSRPNSQFLESFEKLDLSAKGRLELVEGELFSSRPNSQFIENFGSELNEDELSFETVTKSERSYLRHIEDETIDIVTKSDKASESESLRESLRCVEDEVAGTVTKTETKSFSHVEDETEGTVTKSDTASERVSLSHVEDETVGTIIASVRESLRYVEDETTSTVTTIKTTTSTLIDDVKTTSYKKKVMDKREKAILRTLAKIDRSMEVDLCYVLDCTGSMGGHIAAAKDCILQVAEYFKNTNPCIKVKVGFCGYRDHCDGNSRLQIFDFTNSYEDFRKNLSTVSATGGGDSPEDVLGGLNAAVTQMSWSNGTRVIFHIGDYPPHGKRFTTLSDDYPNGDPHGLTAESVLEKVLSENIYYFFGKITRHTDTMIKVFREIIGDFLTFDLIGGDPIELINKFVEATTTSITTSILSNSSSKSSFSSRRSVNSSHEIRDINPNVPDWNTLSIHKGVLLCCYIPKNGDELKNVEYFKKENLIAKNFYFKIAPQPFSSGKEKYAYFAINTKCNPPRPIVMKEYKRTRSGDPFAKYLESVEISALISYLTIKFNLIAGKKGFPSVDFLNVALVRAVIDSRTRYYITEPELQGANFIRFNSNAGVIVRPRPVLEAFVHFTYEHTNGYLVVCDLQGIELPNRFLLTDPAIHCIDNTRFGGTNLGEDGIARCFTNTHRCNDVCKQLGLPTHEVPYLT